MRSDPGISDPVQAGALALQRVLALEGRNALARVELAASELVRLEASPAYRDRITAIREAVAELESVLDKIERLSSPRRGTVTGEGVRLESVWVPLAQRLAPALAARGIVLAWESGWDESALALTTPVLERLLLGALRMAVSAVDEPGSEAELEPIVFWVDCRDAGACLEWVASVGGSTSERRLRIQPGPRVELEVALGEWRAELVDESLASPSGVGIRLRKSVFDD